MRRQLYEHITKTNYNGMKDKIKKIQKKTTTRKVSRSNNNRSS